MKSGQHSNFISCDWGTSRMRLRIVQDGDLAILCEHTSDKGISHTFTQWNSAGNTRNRSLYYAQVLGEGLNRLEQDSGIQTGGIPILCSGMASSSMGVYELPYAKLPFPLDGSNAIAKRIAASGALRNPLFIISGLASESDVMRGEETELTGLNGTVSGLAGDYLAILPGTHSKHIRVKDETIVEFRTYMSGEVFALLSAHSTLRHSLEATPDTYWNAFEKGLEQSGTAPLLSNLFQVRALQLLNKAEKNQNQSFLSGLIIGAELQELKQRNFSQVVIAGNDKLRPLYVHALHYMNLGSRLNEIPAHIYDQAVAAGQRCIFQQHSKRYA